MFGLAISSLRSSAVAIQPDLGCSVLWASQVMPGTRVGDDMRKYVRSLFDTLVLAPMTLVHQ